MVSALTGEGAEALAEAMAEGVAAVRRALPSEEAAPVRTYRAADEAAIGVAREGGGFRVSGRRVERLVAMADLETDDGLAYLQRQLDRLGVDKALREAGVREGDLVRIGPFELEWA